MRKEGRRHAYAPSCGAGQAAALAYVAALRAAGGASGDDALAVTLGAWRAAECRYVASVPPAMKARAPLIASSARSLNPLPSR